MSNSLSTDEVIEAGRINHEDLRILEAILFASRTPIKLDDVRQFLSADADADALMTRLGEKYAQAGFHLVRRGEGYAFRTAEDLSYLLYPEKIERKRLSRAAVEILAIIAYHQPVTRAEIEDVRGVVTSRGTLDVLLEAGWVRMLGRRRTPGRPVTYGTSSEFLDHFGLETLADLPGLNELKGAGFLSGNLPPDFSIHSPGETDSFDNEDPIDANERDGK